MKKLLLTALCILMMNTSLFARDIIPFTVSFDDNAPIGNERPKSPMRPPVVYMEDYTLTFVVDHPDYILNIMDEDGAVVYSTVVYSTQTQVVLPSTLTGDYEIQLVMGNWLFSGWINL